MWKTNNSDVKNSRMEKIVEMLNLFYKMPNNYISSQDKFMMPVINLDYTRNYKDLQRIKFSN